jgi:alkanesulfonate monooxygenase SsuD/methylene tetrahydromethanopterin reductase-like flavin-dependent oxidoreductase (luciferase family)
MLRIAVELTSDLVTSGEFLADVQAYEAAGADAIWLAPESLEPLTLLAAAAVVTSRVGLVASLAAPSPWPADLLAAVVATLRRLSRDRVAFGVPGTAPPDAIARLRATAGGQLVLVTGAEARSLACAAQHGDGLVCDLEAAADAFERVLALERPAPDGPFELWARVPAPVGRAAWRDALGAAEELEATGVVVPHAPNLLDILRNPEEDDRQDLAMAVG